MKIFIFLLIAAGWGRSCFSQVPDTSRIFVMPNPYLLPISKAAIKGSYPIEVAYQKTTHIIFPARIKDFDAGSDAVIALVPENVTNVLRVKANVKGFAEETNMTIITEDGGFYSFLVNYNENPEVFNINIANNLQSDTQVASHLGIGSTNPYNQVNEARRMIPINELQSFCQKISTKSAYISGTGMAKNECSAMLMGVYRKQDVTFLQIKLQNESELDYEWDFIKFFLKEGQSIKRMAVQNEELIPLYIHPESTQTLSPKTERKFVFALPIKSINENKLISVEIYERGGGRHLTFEIDDSLLNKAKNL